MKSLSSSSLGNRYPTGGNQSRQSAKPLSRRKMNSGCLRSGSLEAQPEWGFWCKWLLEGGLSGEEEWESRWAGEESQGRMGTLIQTCVSLVTGSPQKCKLHHRDGSTLQKGLLLPLCWSVTGPEVPRACGGVITSLERWLWFKHGQWAAQGQLWPRVVGAQCAWWSGNGQVLRRAPGLALAQLNDWATENTRDLSQNRHFGGVILPLQTSSLLFQ